MKKETKKEKRDRILAELKRLSMPPVDPELAHGEADDLLVELIDDEEIAAAYEAVEKWYA